MDFGNVTYIGPKVDDPGLLDELPPPLASILRKNNGLVAFRGGLHLRGACESPAWHALRPVWRGPESIASRYPPVRSDDVPFAQDALGDQFLLRDGLVIRLAAETGDLQSFGATLTEFLAAACADPIGYLDLQPLQQFEASGQRLEPGQLLHAYPPFCTRESANGVHLRAIPAVEQLSVLASLASQLRDLSNGTRVEFKVEP